MIGWRRPHCPAGHFSPYSDGDAARTALQNCPNVAASSLLPVAIRGEGAGRRMRGSANVK
ncbi:hypothetical protein EN858_31200 [Mesorhizobium sp. M4B.F.Ca.ET.215.01.1.1]|nr:hypothetical protein EOA34_20265 [Mesorhizobium sp. M4B.F.Ca.ET.013.02.1.1]RUW77099.1 hypothetical protein EOA31_05415 [Mesorhizobium sp. M4B.F.Ca.ET.049.02.1.2]RVD22327.1 hypothetical protein EN738_18050 [Mesorhizobium sp. M4B.F.Ca.ET.017.02.2.1]RVD46190.1 hypothetical protein EN741_02355 [Mesorhizobium sp. M4B.F.Ca.ET.019.03.1.1]RWC94307.1 MAG: hypothetical protein EOS32_17850 [Mesorhizobium sp.]RWX69591.1 hypothetical protein EN780_05900 [Mesorhizobium sp. M4B.F.Ca.ET.089.01.1.1]TGQ0475